MLGQTDLIDLCSNLNLQALGFSLQDSVTQAERANRPASSDCVLGAT